MNSQEEENTIPPVLTPTAAAAFVNRFGVNSAQGLRTIRLK